MKEQIIPLAAAHQSSAGRSGRAAVLIVDDNESIRSLLAKLLAKWGFASLGAQDGLTALEFLSTHPIGLVLADYQMPGMNGLELLAQIQARHPAIPVIMMSSTATSASIEAAECGGAFAWVSKPFDCDLLRTAVLKAWQTVGETPA